MARSDLTSKEPSSAIDLNNKKSLWRRFLGQANAMDSAPASSNNSPNPGEGDDPHSELIRRVSRKVVPGLPRAQTFKRQQSERRNKLEPVQPTPAERRALSVDRRAHASQQGSQTQSNPRTSAPDFIHHDIHSDTPSVPSLPTSPVGERLRESVGELSVLSAGHDDDSHHVADTASLVDAASMTTSQYDSMIHDELERIWILNLSMHFRDKSKREKFFVTYRERSTLWRRVTVSLDYRNAPQNSLEMDLLYTKFQRDKSAKIYEAIRESLVDIQFYDTVTNLKLQTTEGRLHVHVVEDVNEIIHFPTTRMIHHLGCRHIKEREIDFDSHMSGFVYKVKVNGETLIKKEIPGPDTVDEFLYEINALNRLRYSHNVIQFYGVIVDDRDEYVKGLLISYAEQGALIDVIFDNDHSLPWSTREKWARQIVEGLSDIHESGFVQGDFTLSNIVIDQHDNAKIIDINRRGCPVGWEPPEATPLIESNQRISMYIGVKSDLYQLGMVLWALAVQEDEPESHGRPLQIGSDLDVPDWYCTVVETCLADDPRIRSSAFNLLKFFPDPEGGVADFDDRNPPSISVDDGVSVQEYFVEAVQSNGPPRIRTVQPPNEWSHVSGFGHTYVDPPTNTSQEPYYFPTRGRSPPSRLPSNHVHSEAPRFGRRVPVWTDNRPGGVNALSTGDITPDEADEDDFDKSATPRTSKESVSALGKVEIPPPPETALVEAGGVATGVVSESRVGEGKKENEGSAALGSPHGGETAGVQAPRVEAAQPTLAQAEAAGFEAAGNNDRQQSLAATEQQQQLRIAATQAKPVATEDGKSAGKDGAHAEQDPLFRESGTTEPAFQNNRMEDKAFMALSEAENQQNDSASAGVASKEDPQGQARPIEPAAAPSPRPGSHRSSASGSEGVPDDLRGCGSAYDQSNEETMRSSSSIDDDIDMLTKTITTDGKQT